MIVLQLDLTDQAHQVFLLVVFSMREVEPKYIGTREKQLLDHLQCEAGGAQCGDLLGGLAKPARVDREVDLCI